MTRPFPTLPVCSRTFLAHPSSVCHGHGEEATLENLEHSRTCEHLSPSAERQKILVSFIISSSSSLRRVFIDWSSSTSLISLQDHSYLYSSELGVNPSYVSGNDPPAWWTRFLISCEHYHICRLQSHSKRVCYCYCYCMCRLVLRGDDL